MSSEHKGIMLIEKKKKSNSKTSDRDVHHALSQENACYVLITCGQPSEDGKMQVEMIYEGDVSLAAYLIESAQGLLDNHE
jgi:hypothetical protein